VLVGSTRLKGGRCIPVWSCEGHREGVDGATSLSRVIDSPDAEQDGGREQHYGDRQ